MNLSTGAQTVVEGVASFTFSPNGAFVAMLSKRPRA